MTKHKIGWCTMTFNPCWGCRNHCEYCYARGIAKRFYNVIADKEYEYMYYKNEICAGEFANRLRHFVPTFINSQFNKKLPKKPQRIFLGSMSEIYYWEEVWMEKVLEKIKEYPQHIFMFLTQHSEVYAKYLFSSNCWFGITITRNKPIERIGCIPTRKGIKFLSIEPILEKINIEHIDDFEPDWLIVGAETGNRKGKVVPQKEWIEVVIDFCNRTNRPLFIKDNLSKYYPEYKNIKEFPEVR